jgi:hypothetical protein
MYEPRELVAADDAARAEYGPEVVTGKTVEHPGARGIRAVVHEPVMLVVAAEGSGYPVYVVERDPVLLDDQAYLVAEVSQTVELVVHALDDLFGLLTELFAVVFLACVGGHSCRHQLRTGSGRVEAQQVEERREYGEQGPEHGAQDARETGALPRLVHIAVVGCTDLLAYRPGAPFPVGSYGLQHERYVGVGPRAGVEGVEEDLQGVVLFKSLERSQAVGLAAPMGFYSSVATRRLRWGDREVDGIREAPLSLSMRASRTLSGNCLNAGTVTYRTLSPWAA